MKHIEKRTILRPPIRNHRNRLPNDFPPTVDPKTIDCTKEFVLAVRGLTGSLMLIGPFKVVGQLSTIVNMPPFDGHCGLHVKILSTQVLKRIVVPTGGFAVIYGMQYSLHEHSKEADIYFASALTKVRASAERALAKKIFCRNKYLD